MSDSLRPYGLLPSRLLFPGIFQARRLEWVAISSSRGSSPPNDRTCISSVSCITGRFFTAKLPQKPCHMLYLWFYLNTIVINTHVPRWLSGRIHCQSKGCRFNLSVKKIPWRRKRQPALAFLPLKSCGQKRLARYSPLDFKRVRHNLVSKQ